MNCTVSHPFSVIQRAPPSPWDALEIPDMSCELWRRLGGSEGSQSTPGQQVSGFLGWEESLSRRGCGGGDWQEGEARQRLELA